MDNSLSFYSYEVEGETLNNISLKRSFAAFFFVSLIIIN
jgi:hypothetical protein